LPGQFGTQSYFMLLHVAGMTGVPHRVFFCWDGISYTFFAQADLEPQSPQCQTPK
jgi:hypothetical protein